MVYYILRVVKFNLIWSLLNESEDSYAELRDDDDDDVSFAGY